MCAMLVTRAHIECGLSDGLTVIKAKFPCGGTPFLVFNFGVLHEVTGFTHIHIIGRRGFGGRITVQYIAQLQIQAFTFTAIFNIAVRPRDSLGVFVIARGGGKLLISKGHPVMGAVVGSIFIAGKI